MDPEQRELIHKNFEFLINNCKSNILLPRLRGNIAISSGDYAELEKIQDPKKQCRQLLFFLMERGPNTFDAIIDALLESNQMNILTQLKPDMNVHGPRQVRHKHSTKMFQQPNYYEDRNNAANVTTQSAPLEILVKFASNFDYEEVEKLAGNPIYNTTTRNRGLVKIINVFDIPDQRLRRGSEVDVTNLTSLFTQSGLIVEVNDNNPTGNEIKKEISNLVVDPRLKDADMVILFIMSHGGQIDEKDYILGSDKMVLYLKDIEKKFTNDECILMQHKPKLIFYQTCRGAFPDYGVVSRVESDGHVHNQFKNIPTHSDLIIAHSTCPDLMSHRDTVVGTWFIYILCEVFMNHAHEKDIEALLKIVYHKLRIERTPAEGSMQTGEYTNRTFNKCYLNPGIYRDSNNKVCIFNLDEA